MKLPKPITLLYSTLKLKKAYLNPPTLMDALTGGDIPAMPHLYRPHLNTLLKMEHRWKLSMKCLLQLLKAINLNRILSTSEQINKKITQLK
jgi:hypothetical protein